MKFPSHVGAVALTATLLGTSALAQPQPSAAALGVLGERDQFLQVFDRMPRRDLEAVFLRCSRESSLRYMGFDQAVPCAMAWDALLRRGFDGHVDALLAWWRVHRDDGPAR
jgi:hypothetical protein